MQANPLTLDAMLNQHFTSLVNQGRMGARMGVPSEACLR